MPGLQLRAFFDAPWDWLGEPAPAGGKEAFWRNCYWLSWHCHFDALIAAHHYQCFPGMLGCPMSMLRPLLRRTQSLALSSIRKLFGFPPKTTPYGYMKGYRWHEFTPQVQRLVGEGACDEVESIFAIASRIFPGFPPDELELIHMTIAMFAWPCLEADVSMLSRIYHAERQAKATRAAKLGLTPADLRSTAKFVNALQQLGVEVDYKPNDKDELIPAIAKKDRFMQELMADPDDMVRALAEARLGASSSLLESRAMTIGSMAIRGPVCVYLYVYGAHTLRWAGGDRTNYQNFTRDKKDTVVSLRKAHRPARAMGRVKLKKIDLSQIEYRILCYVSGQHDMLELLRRKVDLYCRMATKIYGRTITKADQAERGNGKQIVLSSGYQAGDETIQRTAASGQYGPPVYIYLDEARRWKLAYRADHPCVVNLWAEAGTIIKTLKYRDRDRQWGPTYVKDGRIWLPNGLSLDYTTLFKWKSEDGTSAQWYIIGRDGPTKMYGGKLVENWIQALARIVCAQGLLRIHRLGYRVPNMEHDAGWILIPEDGEEEHMARCYQEMVRIPSWLPGIPLDAEWSDGA